MKILKYIMVVSASLLLGSCMDTEPQGTDLTTTQKTSTVAENPARLAASVAAITANFSQYEAIRSAHSDFGFGSIMLHLESRGIDMVSQNIGYNWFGFSLSYDNVDNSYGNDREIWGTLYNQIYSANAVTAVVDSMTTDSQLQYYLAQALAIRAFDYFNLVQIYAPTYGYTDVDKTAAVPVITEKNKDEAATNGCARASVAGVYKQILSDLDRAITLLGKSGVSRDDKRYVDINVAHAIRARVYLVMRNWKAALEDAEYVISNSGATPKDLGNAGTPSFNSMTENDWLWGIKISETDDVVKSGIVNWPSHMGSLCYGYATVGGWRRINKKLFNSIPSSDKRKTWFLDENASSSSLTAAQNNYLAEQAAPAYAQVKFAPYKDVAGQSTNAQDIPLIRVEEMYYIKAEAEAMGGNASKGAQDLVSFVRQYRDPAYSLSATTGEAVQEAVYQQRRVEFWGEGLSWFDLIRLNKDFDRRGGGFDANDCFDIKAGDKVLIWPIPENEVQYNKLIPTGTGGGLSKPTAVADKD
ncbi:MAG: RagB/SusD family nutrient uptake outer membrane protein [Prevotella sp.]|nr:RagB/SusD family nutrient uptake outer membrane protein [Prevotella sp.]